MEGNHDLEQLGALLAGLYNSLFEDECPKCEERDACTLAPLCIALLQVKCEWGDDGIEYRIAGCLTDEEVV